MSKIRILLVLLSFVILFQGFDSQAQEAKARWEIACMIRSDKFDYVLPRAMRNNNIDMWIVIDKGRGTEPLFQDFGESTSNGNGILIFTDRGGDRIERAALYRHRNMLAKSDIYDIFGRPDDLKSLVETRNPKRIGVNMTTAKELFPPEGRHLGDGLSHTDYINLKKTLGEPYASRLVSAEKLISDFRSERVASEIVEFAKIADITRKLEEQALSNEVITPGKTTLQDVNWWLEEQVHALGLKRGWYFGAFISLPDGTEINELDRVIQPGDVIQIDWSTGRNNFFTDMKRFAYVLKENETEVPPGIQNAFDESRKVRDLIQKNVRSGRTGREQLDNLKRLVVKAGYVYTEVEYAREVKGIEVNIGMHATGNLGHDVGAGLFEFYPVRTAYEISPNSLISVEFIVFVPAAEWGGNKVPVRIEENALITEHGIEWIHPPQNRILVIR
jgi:Xaa-Pro aminopeptidase